MASDPKIIIGPLKYPLWSAAELVSMQAPENRWIIPGLIPRCGSTIIYGPGNEYKTWITLGALLSFGSEEGKVFGGIAPQGVGKIIAISTEGIIEDFGERLQYFFRAQNANPNKVKLYGSTRILPLNRPEGVKTFREILGDLRPDAVLLDPYIHFFPGMNENSTEDAGMITSWLKEIIQEFETSITIIHHTNKGGSMRGSTVLYDWADSSISFSAERKKKIVGCEEKYDVVRLVQDKSRLRGRMDAFYVVPQIDDEAGTAFFTMVKGPEDQVEVSSVENAAKIWSYLQLKPGASTAQIKKDLNRGDDKVKDALTFLQVRGMLEEIDSPRKMGPRGTERERNVKGWRIIATKTDLIRAILRAMREQEKDLEALLYAGS